MLFSVILTTARREAKLHHMTVVKMSPNKI